MLRAQVMLTAMVWMFAAISLAAQSPQTDTQPPHLERHGETTQLVVDGQSYLVLAGELHNSSSSSIRYMEPVWPRLAALHLNTILVPVAWETIEPEEHRFDFSNVDGLLAGARNSHLKLVILWFGAWKNTYSTYVAAWVKTNPERFARVRTSDGRGTERLSSFSVEVRDADARAFARLLRHLREVDVATHSVLMVQVENEVGVIPESRDHSPAAETAFAAAVPSALVRFMQQHRAALDPQLRSAWEDGGAKSAGSWQELFGRRPLTDDLFMAWQYATYVEQVAAAGKAEYPLPMYANAALIRPNYLPGQYNSGGPLPHSMDLWRVAAPSLDFLSPDLYFNEFAQWAGWYARPGNPLFVPEAQGGITGAANALYAYGHLAAIGFSAFGIDDQDNAPLDLAGITTPGEHPDGAALGDAYAVLSRLAPLILDKQRTGGVDAALIEGPAQRSARLAIGQYNATLTPAAGTAAASMRSSALFIQTAASEFLVVGSGDAQITFSADSPGPPIVGIESIDEEFFENGSWTVGRRLNGDESSQGQALRIRGTDLAQGRFYRVRLYRYR
jgi:Domain of unknown function (DUF5597)/Glycosyl hydrolases family 35